MEREFMVYPSGIEAATQRIQEILERFEALEQRHEASPPEADLNTFGRILNGKINSNLNGLPGNASQFEGMIESQAIEQGLDPSLVKAVVKAESGFNPSVVSSAGAKGLMQLMPSTAESLGVRAILDPTENVEGGTKYLKSLLEKYHSVPQALAAYNAGPGAVDKYGGIPPYKETQNYVRNVLNYYQKYEKQGITE